MTAGRRRCALTEAFAPAIWAKASLVRHTFCSVQASVSVQTILWTDTDGSRARCHLRFSFATLPAVSLISVPPDGCFPTRIAVLASSVPPNETFSALIAVWRPSVPPNACFPAPTTVFASSVPPNAVSPAPPPTGCHGRRQRRAAAVGSVLWPSSRRPLPRIVCGRGIQTRVNSAPVSRMRPRPRRQPQLPDNRRLPSMSRCGQLPLSLANQSPRRLIRFADK